MAICGDRRSGARRRGEAAHRRPTSRRVTASVRDATVKQTVLVVDDEPEIVEIVERYLADEGFIVLRAYDGAQAVEAFVSGRPDLVILDLKMPVMHGIDAFKAIRAQSSVPVIMLTSRSDEVDRVVGLELGADDYITKPFSPREVVARVNAVLRRTRADGRPTAVVEESENAGGAKRVGDLEIDPTEHEVRLKGTAISLTPTEFRILEVLASNPGRTYTRTQLLDTIRHDDLEIYDRTLDRHIANLRHKIEDDAAKPRYIQTVFGVGYKMAKAT
jgi:DNA-binding response OmpR family regulator